MTAGSFEEFVADRSAGLLRTAYLLTGDRVEARDLVQGALIATERSWDRFTDQEEATAQRDSLGVAPAPPQNAPVKPGLPRP